MCNKLLVFLATGLWHGNGLTFVLWGLWHGLWSCVETALHLPKKLERKWYGHVHTLLVVIFGFALFRAASPAQGFALWRAMLTGFHADNVCRAALSDAADYFAGRFGLRQELITADAAVRAAVFHESAADDVLLGTDGWLYNADTLGDFTGSSAMTERQLWCAARNLALMQEYAASRGAQLLFVCAPNKNTVYPEFMPARYVRSTSERNLCWLCTRPPLLPAPVREQTFDGATDFGTLDVTRSSAREHYHALYKWADETIALHHVFTSNQRLDRR